MVSLCGLPGWVQAQAQDANDRVVVTGSREPLARHLLAADVVVIDAERIRQTGADSVEDLLRREAGLQVLRNGGPGQAAGLSIRGASRGQTLLLIDGVRVGSATLGTPELDTISLAGIERIEVLRGPGSSLFGADALGGVVNIVTRRGAGAPSAQARVAAGSYGGREASASLRGGAGLFDGTVTVAEERMRGISSLRMGDPYGAFNPDTDGFVRSSAAVQLGLTPQPGHRVGLSLRSGRSNVQYDDATYPPPNYEPDPRGDFRTRGRTELAALDYRGRISPDLTLTARLAQDKSVSGAGASEISDWSRYSTRRESSLLQGTWQPAQGQQLTLAVEHQNERAQSSSYARDGERRNDALTLAYVGTLGAAALQADVRRDRNTQFGSVGTGRLGVRVPLSGGASGSAQRGGFGLRALAGSAFRAPSFNDLIYPGYGVDTLKPERASSTEFGVDWRGSVGSGAGEAALTVYRQNVRDLIAYEPNPNRCPPFPANGLSNPDYPFGCAANVQAARLQGATLSGSVQWAAWQWRATADWLDAKDRATGERLPRRAANQFSTALGWREGAWRANAEVVHAAARTDGGTVLPATSKLDILSAWAFAPGWSAQAKLLNATNNRAEPLLGYQSLGRQGWLELRWQGGL